MKKLISKAGLILVVIPASTNSGASINALGYVIGSFIALLIVVYLVYSLIKPENF